MAKVSEEELLKTVWIPAWLHQLVKAIGDHNGETITEVLTRCCTAPVKREYRKVRAEIDERVMGGEG
jgi:hypothetical protein